MFDMHRYQIALVFLVSIGLVQYTHAQTFSDNVYRNSNNKMYWQNRKPHAAYWQQDVAYQIKARIDEKTNIIDATEDLTYWNNSPDTLNFVYFHLYQNAFVNGSYLMDLHQANHQPIRNLGPYSQRGLGTGIDQFMVDGNPTRIEMDNTIMKIYLPKPLRPGAQVHFSMHFKTYFDHGDFRRRMNAYNSFGFTHYNGVHWYPRISVYDTKKGWDTDQHLNKELYGDYGLFDVELNFASNYVVEATGVLQNSSDVYPGDLRQRLDIKNFANKPWNERPSVITPYDSNQRKTWHYVAYNVHDFAFTADPSYRIGESEWNGIRCVALVCEPHAAKWQTTSEYVKKIIQCYSNNFGMFEYPKIVAADANDGMEYPMLTLDGGGEPDNHSLLTHEIGHNWFYGMLGNNETYRAALDEGFTQFITAWGLKEIDGPTVISTPEKNKYKASHRIKANPIDNSVYRRYMNDAIRGIDKPLNTHSNDFHGALGHENGYSNVYHKTATMLYNLQYVLGDSLFLQAMKHYVSKWKIAHPYFEDFRQSIIECTHEDLNWFFDEWMETTKHIDYGITSINPTKEKDVYEIKFKRYGDMQMPVDFRVIAKNKLIYDFTIPNTYLRKKCDATQLPQWYGWDILRPSYTARVTIPSGIHLVQIDPTYRLADIDMMDNYKSPNQMLARESLHLQLEHYIYNNPDWKKYDAFWRPDIWWNALDGIKIGYHFDGSYNNFLRKLYTTVWFNTRLLSAEMNQASGRWKTNSPIDYTLRYETPLKQINQKINWGLESRFMDGYAKHSVYSTWALRDNDQLRIEGTTLYRNRTITNAYLFYPKEWSSFSDGKNDNTMKNSYLQLQFLHSYRVTNGSGMLKLTVRSPFTYSYAYAQGECIQRKAWKKLDINTRVFARFGTGSSIPNESALFLSGANPEEMMENKFTRSQGIIPAEMGTYSMDHFSHLQASGGLNLRGYAGYYAVDASQGGTYINYKGRSGASVNMEIEFDRLFPLKPKYIRDYLHLDTYFFGDAGAMSRGIINNADITQLNPVKQWSKLRVDAGIGAALTIKKLGPLEKISPFVLRFDIPFFINATPYHQNNNFDFRWVFGVNRSF